MAKISVIIPVFNVEDYLNECLDSVCNQTFRDIEVICVDDGSTDNSLKILKEYERNDPRFIIISQKNSGQGHARRVGLDNASGDFILFLDSDDFIELNTLELLHNNIISNDSDVVLFKLIRYNHINSQKSYDNPAFDLDSIFNENFERFTFYYGDIKQYVLNKAYCPVCKFYKKDFLTKYDDFFFAANIRYEDVPFHVQVMLRAKLSFCPFFLYNYRISNSTSTMNTSSNEKVMDIFNIIDIVEKLLIDEGVYNEFKVEFNKFKFEQILAYLLPSKSDKYFIKSKNVLNEFKINFYCNDYNLCQYESLVNSSNFNEFQTKLIVELKNKIFSLNSVINNKNNIIKSNENDFLEQEKNINKIRQLFDLKNKNITDKELRINQKVKLLNLKDQHLVDKEKSIIEMEKLVDSKDQILIERESNLLEKNYILDSREKYILKKEKDILEKQRILGLKFVEIDSSLLNNDSFFSSTSQILNMIFSDAGEKINYSKNWNKLGDVSEEGIFQSNTSDIQISNEVYIFEKPFHIEFDVIKSSHPHEVRLRIFTEDATVSARNLKQLGVVNSGHVSIDVLENQVIWHVNGIKKFSQNVIFDTLIRVGWFIPKNGASVTYKNFRIFTL